MDDVRKFRIIVAPFFYFAWLVLGYWLGGGHLPIEKEKEFPWGAMIALGAAAAVPVGFLISRLSIGILKLGFQLFGHRPYEALSGKELAKNGVWKHIGLVEPGSNRTVGRKRLLDTARGISGHEIYATATFDHSIIPESLNAWVARRWNVFSASAHSVVAIALALATAKWLVTDIHFTCTWKTLSLLTIALLSISAAIAWQETMGMLKFQALRDHAKKELKSNDEAIEKSGNEAAGSRS